MEPRRTLALAPLLLLLPLAAAAQEPAPSSGDRSVEASRAAVLPPRGEVNPDLALAIHQALREEAASRGWQLCDEGDIRVALTGREGPGFDTPELVEIGRWLGAGVVIGADLANLGGEIEIRLRVLSTTDGPSAMQLRMASKKSAPKEARQGLAEALPQAPPPAAIRVPPPPAPPAPPPPPPPPAPAVQVVAVPPGYVLVAPGVIAPAPVQAPAVPAGRAPDPPAPTEAELQAPAPREFGRGAKVFGVTLGAQAAALGLSAWIILENDYSDTDMRTAAIMYSVIAPTVSALGGWGIGSRSRVSTISYGAILGGTYAGSAVSLALALLTWNKADETWFWTWFVGPLVLPATGAAIAFAAGKERRSVHRAVAFAGGRVEWSLPSPTVIAAGDGSARLSPGLSLGTLTF